MFFDRIKQAEKKWNKSLDIFYKARQEYLPPFLRCEDNPVKLKLCKQKQNHYRLTGEVIMMENEYKHYANNFNINTLWE